MPFNITLDNPEITRQLTQVGESLDRELTNWLVDMAMWVKADLKQRVPVKTGQLKNSIRYEIANGEATFHSVFYGDILDRGSKPFTIQPAGAKTMAFYSGGEQIFATTVKHPGIKPRNFTIETLEAAEAESGRQADVIAERIFRAVVT